LGELILKKLFEIDLKRKNFVNRSVYINIWKKLIFFLMASTMIFSLTACEKLIEKVAKKQMGEVRTKMLTDGNLHVVLVGTGGPMPNKKRHSASVAVIAGGEFILVDTGPGSARNAMLQKLPIGNLSAVFLTHYHSDHIADLGEVNLYSWIQGNRKQRLEVFGPDGVDKVVKGYALAYELDAGYRTAHHGEAVAPTSGAVPVAKTVTIEEPGKARLFFERNGLKAYMFEVDHFPAKPAVGYRFEYKGNVVVISGDTIKTPTLAKFADKAYLFVCEALDAKTTAIVAKVASEINLPGIAKIFIDIPDYQLTPVQAAEVAQEAQVKKLVYYHIVPPLTNFILERRFLEGVDDVYAGEIELGEDGMTFEFEPKPK
jgi:ribonuclease Z